MKISSSVFWIAVAIALSAFSASRLDATVTFNYTGAGQFTYITAPGGAASQDSYFANITDLTFGAGTLSVSGDVTDYSTGTGGSGPGTAVFTFGANTFSGSSSSVYNFATGGWSTSFTITSGTGTFSGDSGTVTEQAQFTSFGSFSPNVPANFTITAGSGTLVAPEPSTAMTALAGGAMFLIAMRRNRKALAGR